MVDFKAPIKKNRCVEQRVLSGNLTKPRSEPFGVLQECQGGGTRSKRLFAVGERHAYTLGLIDVMVQRKRHGGAGLGFVGAHVTKLDAANDFASYLVVANAVLQVMFNTRCQEQRGLG